MSFCRLVTTSGNVYRRRTGDVFQLLRYKTEGPVAVNKMSDQGNEAIYQYPTPILFGQLIERIRCYKLLNEKLYSPALIGLGVSHCLSYIAYFCRYEARERGIDVVSLSAKSTDTTPIDKEVIDDYYSHFMKKLEIVSVSTDPELAEFQTVDQLIEQRPIIVRNCVLLLIAPESDLSSKSAVSEIDVIRKLQPRSVLTVFEAKGMFGTRDFRAFLRGDPNHSRGLDNYTIEELWHQVVNKEAGEQMVKSASGEEEKKYIEPGTCVLEFKVVKLRRKDCLEEDKVTASALAEKGEQDSAKDNAAESEASIPAADSEKSMNL